MVEYPYMVSNNKISMIFDKIQTAAIPSKFTNDFLKRMGFASSNDRAFSNLLKKLNFISADGTPSTIYSNLKDSSLAKRTIATQIKELYADLFSINTEINVASDEEIKGAIARVTGKEEKDVKRIFATFKALCDYADFSVSYSKKNTENTEVNSVEIEQPLPVVSSDNIGADFHYNIQIHLPATTDISVYNAIFKSIRENLFK